MLMLYFKLGPYSLSGGGILCSDIPGKKSIDTMEDCKNAVGFIRALLPSTALFVTEVEDSLYPNGCYLSIENDRIYFNAAASGYSNDDAMAICIPGM